MFIEDIGRSYIESSENKNKINCPQSRIELPLDAWYCKTAKTACPRQGQLDMSEKNSFFTTCLLSEETKKGIWNAIISGKYKGFHHVPGRFRCGLCDKPQINYNYHFPWELTSLGDHCDISSIWNNIKRAKELILDGFPRGAISTKLCSECFLKVSNFVPEINLSEYEIITYEYKRNK